ncbi:MAG: hypothetical protein ACD_20C00090G0008 [uncultured bacterium]|nr:MAG: hypothetical protein ACD_20C00090G0008 [uncultured bacterium]HBH18549.1 hypothetical protein [Cyanobacteria bacterium UBA9579]
MTWVRNKNFIKYIISFVILLMSIWTYSNVAVFAQTAVVTCGSPTVTLVSPRHTFKWSCNAAVSGLRSQGRYTYDLYIRTLDYITNWGSGNGSNITYTTPENRFKVLGPTQGATPADISTANPGIKVSALAKTETTASIDFELHYVTYDADYGGTTYNQPFQTLIHDIDAGNYISNTQPPVTFTVEDVESIIISTPPSATVPTGFNLGQDYDSNTFTATVKANNNWTLQTLLTGNLTYNSYNIPVSSNYFRASGAGFTNLAPAKTQFGTANTYYNVAQGTHTGSSDGINLTSGIDVLMTYTVRTTSLFAPAPYTTTTTLNVTTP